MALPPILKLFKAQVGGATYFFLQNPTTYAGSIDTLTGVTEATDAEQDEPAIPVYQLIANQKLFRVVCSVQTSAGIKTRKLLITRDKLSTAFDDLIGETIGGGTVKSVRIPQKAQFF